MRSKHVKNIDMIRLPPVDLTILMMNVITEKKIHPITVVKEVHIMKFEMLIMKREMSLGKGIRYIKTGLEARVTSQEKYPLKAVIALPVEKMVTGEQNVNKWSATSQQEEIRLKLE